MSCIHLHLGQAGIQLGESFWGLAEEEFFVDDGRGDRNRGRGRGGRATASPESSSVRMRAGGTAMFHEDGGWARCLAVDSEPKVVQRFQGRVGSLRPENAIFSQSGLANNWAMGFASCRSLGDGEEGAGGPFSRCMEGMRKEAERSSWLNSVVMTHSLAGGTGSGLGSGLLQALRDEYPSLYLFSACVGPFGTGDTPLQHYNSVLALQHLQAYADCVIYRGNDDLLRGAAETSARRDAAAPDPSRTMGGEGSGTGGWRPAGILSRRGGGGGGGGGNKRRGMVVSTADMNASLALDMASYFFPTSRPFDRFKPTVQAGSGHRRHRQQQQQHQQETAPRPFDGGCLMAAACPLPGAKFVDLRSSLSTGPATAVASHGGQGVSSTSSSATKNTWAVIAHDLGRRAPLSPNKGGGVDDDACVAAHHVIRGVALGAEAAAAGGGATWRGAGAGSETGATAEMANGGGSAIFNARRRMPRCGMYAGINSPAATAEAAAVVATPAPAATAFGAEESAQASEVLRRHHRCPEWRTATDVSGAPALRSRGGTSRSVTTVCNQTRIRGVLGDVVARAEEKFKARAYLHWYYRHGLEDEDFLAAFEGVRSVERGYDGLARAFGDGGGERRKW
ncbi:unnamed protein product [Pylaiella littoralis]